MILSKRDLKKLIESVLKEQDEDFEDILLDDEPVEQPENQEAQEKESQEEQPEKEDFKEVKFYLPRKLINKLVDIPENAEEEEEIEVILKPDSGKLVYTIDGNPPPDLKPIKVMTVVGIGMIYGVDENGEKEKIADQLKDILVLDRSFANKSVGRMKEILSQKIKLGRLNFRKEYLKDAFGFN